VTGVSRAPLVRGGGHLPDYDCVHVRGRVGIGPVLDWDEYHDRAAAWLLHRHYGHKDHIQRASDRLAASWQLVLDQPVQALKECPLAVLFTAALLMNLSLAGGRTRDYEYYERAFEMMFQGTLIHIIAAARWPTFRMLEYLARRVSSPLEQKFIVEFSQLPILGRDLVRLAAASVGLARLGIATRSSAAHSSYSAALSRLANRGPWSMLVEGLTRAAARAVRAWEPVRAARALVTAKQLAVAKEDYETAADLLDVEHSLLAQRRSLPLVVFTVAHGALAEELLPLLGRRLSALGALRHVLFVAADAAAARACSVVFVDGVRCVRAQGASMLLKYAALAVLAYLGVDTLYLDLDAVPLRPLAMLLGRGWSTVESARRRAVAPAVLRISQGTAADFCRLNSGVIFAAPPSASFLVKFLMWLYAHPYEFEQTGLAAFLGVRGVDASYLRPRSANDVEWTIRWEPFDGLERVVEHVVPGWCCDVARIVVYHLAAIPMAEKQALAAKLLSEDLRGARAILATRRNETLRVHPRWARDDC